MDQIHQAGDPAHQKILSVTGIGGISYFAFDHADELHGSGENTLLLYTDRGRVVVSTDNTEVPLSAQKAVFLAPDREYRISVSQNTGIAAILFTTQKGMNRYFDGRSFPVDEFRTELLGKILGCAEDLFEKNFFPEQTLSSKPVSEPSAHAYQFAVECIELFLLDCLKPLYKPFNELSDTKRKTSQSSRTAGSVFSYMQENIGRKLTLDEIADALFFSKSYIKKVCVKETGQSPLHYFSRMKIEKSKELFSRGKSAEEIAKEIGFSSASHFCKVFRNVTGMTTREYRKSVLRDLQE